MTYGMLKSNIAKLRKNKATWREVGLAFPGVPLGTLCRIATDPDYVPKSKALRVKLGLYPPPQPRRKYDRTTKELRAIGARIYIAI